jgi:hypothetical protein
MAAKCDLSVMSATVVWAGSLELPLELLLLLASVVEEEGGELEERREGRSEGRGVERSGDESREDME